MVVRECVHVHERGVGATAFAQSAVTERARQQGSHGQRRRRPPRGSTGECFILPFSSSSASERSRTPAAGPTIAATGSGKVAGSQPADRHRLPDEGRGLTFALEAFGSISVRREGRGKVRRSSRGARGTRQPAPARSLPSDPTTHRQPFLPHYQHPRIDLWFIQFVLTVGRVICGAIVHCYCRIWAVLQCRA